MRSLLIVLGMAVISAQAQLDATDTVAEFMGPYKPLNALLENRKIEAMASEEEGTSWTSFLSLPVKSSGPNIRRKSDGNMRVKKHLLIEKYDATNNIIEKDQFLSTSWSEPNEEA